ncbi:hypothetical protein EMIT0P253_10175 [Pseudomonas sp. IT-P253]
MSFQRVPVACNELMLAKHGLTP